VWADLFAWVGREPLPCRVERNVSVGLMGWENCASGALLVALVNFDTGPAYPGVAIAGEGRGDVRVDDRLRCDGTWESEQDPAQIQNVALDQSSCSQDRTTSTACSRVTTLPTACASSSRSSSQPICGPGLC